MFMFIHALLGAIIGINFNSLTIIIALAVLSHFLLDMIPHWDGPFDKEFFYLFGELKAKKSRVFLAVFDLIITIFLIMELSVRFDSLQVIIGSLASITPDLIGIFYFTNIKNRRRYMKYLKFHSKIQKDATWKIGLAIQIIATIIFAKILF